MLDESGFASGRDRRLMGRSSTASTRAFARDDTMGISSGLRALNPCGRISAEAPHRHASLRLSRSESFGPLLSWPRVAHGRRRRAAIARFFSFRRAERTCGSRHPVPQDHERLDPFRRRPYDAPAFAVAAQAAPLSRKPLAMNNAPVRLGRPADRGHRPSVGDLDRLIVTLACKTLRRRLRPM